MNISNFQNHINLQHILLFTYLDKVIVLAEEFYLDPKDQETTDLLKDVLSGLMALIRIKYGASCTIANAPWLFLSNNDNFDIANTTNSNPFNTRLYRYQVKYFSKWNADTEENHLHPYAWIKLFEKYDKL